MGTQNQIHPPYQEPPDWADDRHIIHGETQWCAHCLKREEEMVELVVTENARMATWMGVNWDDGFEERVECPECGGTGHIRTKLMSSFREQTDFVKDGAAAWQSAEAQMEPDEA